MVNLLGMSFSAQMEAQSPRGVVNRLLSVHKHKKGQEQNHILYVFLNSPRGLGNVGAAESNTHMPEGDFGRANTHTHSLVDAPSSQ